VSRPPAECFRFSYFFSRQLQSLSNDIHELAAREVGRDEVLLLVNVLCWVCLFRNNYFDFENFNDERTSTLLLSTFSQMTGTRSGYLLRTRSLSTCLCSNVCSALNRIVCVDDVGVVLCYRIYISVMCDARS
jgi:hypothetical protein